MINFHCIKTKPQKLFDSFVVYLNFLRFYLLIAKLKRTKIE